jgi:acyl-CoA dehydrogenase
MGKTDPDNENRYQQQSQILVPIDTPGVTIVRPMKVFGNDDAPEGHAEVLFQNVKVPCENIISNCSRSPRPWKDPSLHATGRRCTIRT